MEKNLNLKQIQEFFSKPLEENTTDWPKEVPSRHGDIIFRLVKVMPDRAKYELIDAETGKTWEVGGRVYGTVNQLKASAEDTIKPQGGRQSSQFESVTIDEAKVDYDFSERELIRVLRQLKRNASTEIDMIKAFTKALGRDITKDELFSESIDEDNSYARVSKPRFVKDKNNPNFLNVYIDYDLGPGGSSIALGKETMTGQIRRESAAEAMRLAGDVARDLEAEYDLEDIDIQDLKNGKVQIFAVSDDFIDMDPNMLGESLNENISQEVVNKVSRFITSMANYYDYSEQDAVYAIMQALRAHKGNFQGLNEATEKDPIDTITMDVPLFIRVLEYAREDAQADMDLHDLAEKAISATKQQGLLQMDDYDMLVGELEQIGMEENMSLDDEAKAYYLAKVKRGEIDTLPEDPKAAFLAQMTKDQIDHDKETLRRERGLEEVVSKVISKIKEDRPGLWANIHAQRERGEKPARKGSKDYKAAVKAGKEINKKK